MIGEAQLTEEEFSRGICDVASKLGIMIHCSEDSNGFRFNWFDPMPSRMVKCPAHPDRKHALFLSCQVLVAHFTK